MILYSAQLTIKIEVTVLKETSFTADTNPVKSYDGIKKLYNPL